MLCSGADQSLAIGVNPHIFHRIRNDFDVEICCSPPFVDQHVLAIVSLHVECIGWQLFAKSDNKQLGHAILAGPIRNAHLYIERLAANGRDSEFDDAIGSRGPAASVLISSIRHNYFGLIL